MAGVNSRFATISEAEILKIQEDAYQKTQRRPQVLLRSLSEYNYYSFQSLNGGRIFTKPRRGSVIFYVIHLDFKEQLQYC